MPTIGIEPTTYGLQNRCSTIEPSRHMNNSIKKEFKSQGFLLYNGLYDKEYSTNHYVDDFKCIYDFCMVWTPAS